MESLDALWRSTSDKALRLRAGAPRPILFPARSRAAASSFWSAQRLYFRPIWLRRNDGIEGGLIFLGQQFRTAVFPANHVRCFSICQHFSVRVTNHFVGKFNDAIP